MTTLLAIYLILVSVFIAGMMAVQHMRGTHPLLSVRNFALVGLIVFQTASAATHLWLNEYHVFPVRDPVGTGLKFCVMTTVFLALFLLAYRVGWPASSLARRVPGTRFRPSSGALVMMAVLFSGAATALKVMEGMASGLLTALGLALGCGAMACGLMGWVWGRNLFNPVIVAITGAIFLFNSLVSMIGGFGRRPLVAFGAALLWGLFYSRLRYMRPAVMFQLLGIAAIPPVLVVALFTAARSSGERDRSVGEQVRAMQRVSVKDGLSMLAGGQAVGAGALWTIENYPERFQGTFLHSFWMVFAHPVPRAIWPSKPIPISTLIADQANVRGVSVKEITLPPGIIGYAEAEGGWLALVVYGVFFGLFMRFFDELVSRNPFTPMIVLPVGTQLGQILGLFRGEPSLFGATYWMTVVIFYAALVTLSKMFEGRFVGQGEPDWGVEPVEWSDYQLYGYEYADGATEHVGGAVGDASGTGEARAG